MNLNFLRFIKIEFFEKREIDINKCLKRAIAIIADSELGRENIVRRYLIDYSRVYIVPFSPSVETSNQSKEVKKILKKNFKYLVIIFFIQLNFGHIKIILIFLKVLIF